MTPNDDPMLTAVRFRGEYWTRNDLSPDSGRGHVRVFYHSWHNQYYEDFESFEDVQTFFTTYLDPTNTEFGFAKGSLDCVIDMVHDDDVTRKVELFR